MYMLMFLAGWRLRRTRPDVSRSFRAPLLPLFAILGIAAAAVAIMIGFVPPAQLGSTVSPLTYAIGILVGIFILAIPPQIIYHFRKPTWMSEENIQR